MAALPLSTGASCGCVEKFGTCPETTCESTPKTSMALWLTPKRTIGGPDSPVVVYSVPLTKFLAANPGLKPTKLRIGQELNIPSR